MLLAIWIDKKQPSTNGIIRYRHFLYSSDRNKYKRPLIKEKIVS